MSDRLRDMAFFGVLAAFALLAGGCSLIPRFGSRASAEPDTVGAVHAVGGAADSVASVHGDSLEIGAGTSGSGTAAGADGDSSLSSAGAPAEASAPVAAPAAGAGSNGQRANPAVSIGLEAGERSRLAVETRRDLAEAEFVVRSVRRDHLDTAALDRLSAVEGLIEQARSAYASDDIESAARVARKARLLSLEVTERP